MEDTTGHRRKGCLITSDFDRNEYFRRRRIAAPSANPQERLGAAFPVAAPLCRGVFSASQTRRHSAVATGSRPQRILVPKLHVGMEAPSSKLNFRSQPLPKGPLFFTRVNDPIQTLVENLRDLGFLEWPKMGTRAHGLYRDDRGIGLFLFTTRMYRQRDNCYRRSDQRAM